MRRVLSSMAALVALLIVTTGVVAAVTFHDPATLTYDPDTNSFTATADVSGLGNDPILGTLTVSQTFTYTCRNKGGNIAPGQKGVTETNTEDFTVRADKNGRAVIDETVFAPEPDPVVSGREAG